MISEHSFVRFRSTVFLRFRSAGFYGFGAQFLTLGDEN